MRKARASSSRCIASCVNGCIRANRVPSTTRPGLKMLTRLASPRPSQRPTSANARRAVGDPRFGRGEDRIDRLATTVAAVTRVAEQGKLADLGLPAATRAAAAHPALGVDRDVPDLSAEAGQPGQGLPTDDDAATDAHLGREVDEVVASLPCPAQVLGHGTQVRLIADRHRQVHAKRLDEHPVEREVGPAEVRRQQDEPVGAPDDGHRRYPDPDHAVGVAGDRPDTMDQIDEVLDGRLGRRVATRPVHANELVDRAAQPDDRDRQGVDRRLDREDDRAIGDGVDRRETGGPDAPAAPPGTRARVRARPAPRRGRRPCCGSNPSGRRTPTATSPGAGGHAGGSPTGCHAGPSRGSHQ